MQNDPVKAAIAFLAAQTDGKNLSSSELLHLAVEAGIDRDILGPKANGTKASAVASLGKLLSSRVEEDFEHLDEEGNVKRFRLVKNSRSGKGRSYRFEEIDAVRTTAVAIKSEKKPKGVKKGKSGEKLPKRKAA